MAETTVDTPTLDAPPPGEKAPADFMSDAISDFSVMAEGGTPEEKKEAPKPAEKPKQKESLPEKKPIGKEQPKTQEKPEEKPQEKLEQVKPVKAAELRTAYEGLKKRLKEELEPEVQRLRSKVQEYESKKTEDPAPLLQKVKELEERNNHLEQQIELANFEESKPYQEHQKKFAESWNRALNAFGQLEVTEKIPDGEDEVTGEPKFKIRTRQATQDDLLELARLPIGKMDKRAKEMFQDSSPRVINYVENIKELWESKEQAKVQAAEKAKEWKSRQQTELQVKGQTLAKTWDEVNKNLLEKLPRAFQPDPEDDVDKQAFVKGFALADLMFLGAQGLNPEQIEALPASFRESIKAKQPLSEAQNVQLHALARLKMANHDRQMLKLKRAQDRIQELEKTVAEYEKSEPSGEDAGEGRKKTVDAKDWLSQAEDELKAMDR